MVLVLRSTVAARRGPRLVQSDLVDGPGPPALIRSMTPIQSRNVTITKRHNVILVMTDQRCRILTWLVTCTLALATPGLAQAPPQTGVPVSGHV